MMILEKTLLFNQTFDLRSYAKKQVQVEKCKILKSSSVYRSYITAKTKDQLLGFPSHYILIFHMHINIIKRNKALKNIVAKNADIIQEDISYAKKPKLSGMTFKSILQSLISSFFSNTAPDSKKNFLHLSITALEPDFIYSLTLICHL